jgi:hypothetical protein
MKNYIFLTYSSILKMNAAWCSETSVDFQRTTQRYTSEDGTLLIYRRENMKSYILHQDHKSMKRLIMQFSPVIYSLFSLKFK